MARIANIANIRKELAGIKLNVDLTSKDLDALLKLTKSGLKIKVDLDFGPQLKQLLDLQKKGISVKAGIAGASVPLTSKTSDTARTAKDVANERAARIKIEQEVEFQRAFRERAAEAKRQATAKQQEAQQRELDRAQNNRQLKAYMEAQARQRKMDAAQARSLDAASAFQNQFNQAIQGNFNQANSPAFGGFGGPGAAPFSPINPAQQIRAANIAAQKQRKVRRQLAAIQKVKDNVAKANLFVEDDPLSALLGNDVVGNAASKFNLKRSSITARPNFFKPSRLKDPESLQNILFTTLLGGPGQGLGAAAGVATLGAPGALIGANVAAATIAAFEKVADAMGKAVRAGAEYERAVTGITGIFQATSEIVDKSGNALPIREQLRIQQGRAEGIQGAAQRALLPLGITGATSSALTQSFTAGLAQRGLAPDEKNTEILLRRFGASIQTLQPELASDPNLIRRGFEDIIGGGPQASRTELGSAIRGLAPQLFSGNIKSVEDIVKATAALEDLVVAIKNNDKATIEWQKAMGSLQLAQQELGRGILEGIAPGLKTLSEELAKADTQDGLRQLGQLIGELGTVLLRIFIPGVQNLLDLVRGSGSLVAGLVKAKDQAASGDFSGAAKTIGELATKPITAEEKDKDLAKANEGRKAQGLPPLVKLPNGKLAPESLADRGYTAQSSIQNILLTAKNQFGIEDPQTLAEQGVKTSPENRLRGLQQLRGVLQSRSANRSFKDSTLEQIGLNTQEIDIRRQRQQERNQLFDTGDFGQQRRALDEKGGLRDQVKLAEDNVSKRKQLLNAAQLGTKNEEAIATARLAVQQAEEVAIKLRNEVADKEKELADRRLSIFQKQLGAINQTSFTGQQKALDLTQNFNLNEGLNVKRQIAAQDAIINSKTASPQEINAAKDRRSELEIKQQGIASSEIDRTNSQRGKDLSVLSASVQNPLRREAAKDAAIKSNLDLQQVGFAFKELTLEQNRLAKATRDATKALDELSQDTRLKELGAQGEQIATAEAIVAAGGTVPAGISEALVRGTEGFDPEARRQFEEEIARERFGQVARQTSFSRRSQEESDRRQELTDTKTQLGIDQEKLNLKPEELALQKRAIIRDQRGQPLQNAEEARKALEKDPTNPKLQAEFQSAFKKAEEARKAVEENESQTSGALTTPQGSPTTLPSGKRGSFSIDGEEILPDGTPRGLNISDLGGAQSLIASNTRDNYASAILSGISGTSDIAKVKSTSAKGTEAASEILKGLSRDRSEDAKGSKEVNDGKSIFDSLEALKPPSKNDIRDAFSEALNAQFV